MRLFWVAVLVLVAATAAVFLWPSESGEPPVGASGTPTAWSPGEDTTWRAQPTPGAGVPTPAPDAAPGTGASPTPIGVEVPQAERPAEPSPAAVTPSPAAPVSEPSVERRAAAVAVENPPSEPEALAGDSGGEGPGSDPTGAQVTRELAEAAAPEPEETEPQIAETQTEETPIAAAQAKETGPEAEPIAVADPIAAADPAPADLEVAAPAVPAAPATEAAPPSVQETETGVLLAGRWNVPGRGTAESPFVLNWDMLVAVQREYEPRLGKDTVPEWLAALDGKRVAIEGYALLPIGGGSMSELLVMMNQWDGCCIGVPPSPYDAIEVRLKDRLAPTATQTFGQGGAVAYGRLTGTFQVDAYIVQGWLLGLYLLNDAKAELFGPAGAP